MTTIQSETARFQPANVRNLEPFEIEIGANEKNLEGCTYAPYEQESVRTIKVYPQHFGNASTQGFILGVPVRPTPVGFLINHQTRVEQGEGFEEINGRTGCWVDTRTEQFTQIVDAVVLSRTIVRPVKELASKGGREYAANQAADDVMGRLWPTLVTTGRGTVHVIMTVEGSTGGRVLPTTFELNESILTSNSVLAKAPATVLGRRAMWLEVTEEIAEVLRQDVATEGFEDVLEVAASHACATRLGTGATGGLDPIGNTRGNPTLRFLPNVKASDGSDSLLVVTTTTELLPQGWWNAHPTAGPIRGAENVPAWLAEGDWSGRWLQRAAYLPTLKDAVVVDIEPTDVVPQGWEAGSFDAPTRVIGERFGIHHFRTAPPEHLTRVYPNLSSRGEEAVYLLVNDLEGSWVIGADERFRVTRQPNGEVIDVPQSLVGKRAWWTSRSLDEIITLAKSEPVPVQTFEDLLDDEPAPPVDERDAELERLRTTVENLQAETQQARAQHQADLERISEIMLSEAEDRDWCGEYDQVIDRINSGLHGSLREREHEYEVTLDVTYRITRTVEATSESAARSNVEEDTDALAEAVRYAEPNEVRHVETERM